MFAVDDPSLGVAFEQMDVSGKLAHRVIVTIFCLIAVSMNSWAC